MRVDFSEMRDYEVVEELLEADRLSASLSILGAPINVCKDAEQAVEEKMDEVLDIYGHDEQAMFAIRSSMPGIHMILGHLKEKDN